MSNIVKRHIFPNEAGTCFGLLPEAVRNGMIAAVQAGAECERFDGEKWVPAAFMGKGATLRVVVAMPDIQHCYNCCKIHGYTDKTIPCKVLPCPYSLNEREGFVSFLSALPKPEKNNRTATGLEALFGKKTLQDDIRQIVREEIAHKPVTILEDMEGGMRRIAKEEADISFRQHLKAFINDNRKGE